MQNCFILPQQKASDTIPLGGKRGESNYFHELWLLEFFSWGVEQNIYAHVDVGRETTDSISKAQTEEIKLSL